MHGLYIDLGQVFICRDLHILEIKVLIHKINVTGFLENIQSIHKRLTK